MKQITDNELDQLIHLAFERQERLQQAEKAVMKTIAADARRRTLRHWLRLTAIALTIAAIVAGYGWLLTASRLPEQQPLLALFGGIIVLAAVVQTAVHIKTEQV